MFKPEYYIKRRIRRNSRVNFLARTLILIILLFLVIFLQIKISFNLLNLNNQEIISPLAKEMVQKAIVTINSWDNSKEIDRLVNSVLKEDKINYALLIKNLKTGERYYYNEHKIFETASLYKLWVMAVAYQQIEKNEIRENEILSENISELKKKYIISTDSANLEDEIVTWPIQNALENMITVSDNNSALLLTDKVGLKNVSNFLIQNDLRESKVGFENIGPTSSAYDIGKFFENLYHEQLANKSSTIKMINLLKNQKINYKLPKFIPQNIEIAHKTGELDNLSHDAGIFYTPKADYIIVILSKTNNILYANENMAIISKKIYGYFLK
jgi:beta-lactamase class A